MVTLARIAGAVIVVPFVVDRWLIDCGTDVADPDRRGAETGFGHDL